ncbi:MAG TPA: sensor domain-containing diguanylate cyclase [Desulfurivibrionaceae bacterium]|nr:sensor domain-containing diguanylate cyclase [Desulfurivibrionaceae bacterium]
MDSYKAILDSLYDGIYFVDDQRRITYWNQAAEQITGYDRNEVIGRCCSDRLLRHIDDTGTLLCENGCPLAAAIADGNNREAQVYLHHKDGHRVPVRIRVSPIRDESGRIVGAAELFSDNSAASLVANRMAELEQLTLLDPLTRLANRRFLENSIENCIRELDRYHWATGILFLDVDNFKQVNDDFGHDIGDEVLRRIAATLIANSRGFDLFGRWGGEEFLGVVRNVDTAQLASTAEKLRMLISHATIPVGTDTSLAVTVSIGATLLRHDDTLESVVKRADQLMYQSKKAGKNRVTTEG